MSETGNSPVKLIHIAVVEDDKMVRDVLEILLNGSTGFACVATKRAAKRLLPACPR